MFIKNRKQLIEFFLAGSIAIFLVVLIRILFFQIFIIPSDSMYPTLQEGDAVIVLKYPFKKPSISKNDIVVFNSDNISIVKRVVATENDILIIENGHLFINGKKNTGMEYIFNKNDYYSNTIEKGSIYVLGDNTTNSIDSRDFGSVKIDNVVGKLFFIFSPISRMHIVQ